MTPVLLPWDSEFFGLRIARWPAARMTPRAWTSARRWLRANRIDCLYFLADPAHAPTARLAEREGFRFVDVRLTLERDLARPIPEPAAPVRAAVPEDLGELKRIAEGAHGDSRFFADDRFPRGQCRKLYQTWIARAVEGDAEAVFVGGIPGKPQGYVTCHAGSDPRIGLFAVGAAHRGKGLGRSLVLAALHRLRRAGRATCRVVTQARNVAAQRLYQGCGFVTRDVGHWYHCWPRA